MPDFTYQLKARFSGCYRPEHVEEEMRKILKVIQDEIDFETDQWEEIMETLKDDAEFEEAGWVQ